MQLAIDLGLYARLNAEQIRRDPRTLDVLRRSSPAGVPLNTGEVSRITGTSAKQIRTWEASSLVVPAYRIAGRRRFFSAALVYAFLLKAWTATYIRCLGRILTADQADPLPKELVASAIIQLNTTAVPYGWTRCSQRVLKTATFELETLKEAPYANVK